MVNKHLANQKMNQKQLQYLICLQSGENPGKMLFVNPLTNMVTNKDNILLLDTNSEVIRLEIALQIPVEARFSQCPMSCSLRAYA